MRKTITIFFLSLGFWVCNFAHAQTTMHLLNNSGATGSYLIDDVQVITFTATDVKVKINMGSTTSFVMNDLSKIYFDDNAPLAINEINTPVSRIFPIPSSGIVNLNVTNVNANEVTVNVYSFLGSLVYSNTYSSAGSDFNTTIDLSMLAKGNFIVQMNVGNEVFTEKISIQ